MTSFPNSDSKSWTGILDRRQVSLLFHSKSQTRTGVKTNSDESQHTGSGHLSKNRTPPHTLARLLRLILPRVVLTLRSPGGAANGSPHTGGCAGHHHTIDDGRTRGVDGIDGFGVFPERVREVLLRVWAAILEVTWIPFPFAAAGGATVVDSSSYPITDRTPLQSISSPNLL